MTPDQLAIILNTFQPSVFIKLFALILFFFYFVFSAVVFQKINVMTQVLDTNISPIIKILALIQIFATIGLFFLAVMLL